MSLQLTVNIFQHVSNTLLLSLSPFFAYNQCPPLPVIPPLHLVMRTPGDNINKQYSRISCGYKVVTRSSLIICLSGVECCAVRSLTKCFHLSLEWMI
jgi:hypothetical protein